MDNLTRDAIAAAEAGMSYGRWKAMHPNTNPDRQPEISEVKVYTKIVRCKWCGKEFIRTPKRIALCSDECRAEHVRKSKHEQYIRARYANHKY